MTTRGMSAYRTLDDIDVSGRAAVVDDAHTDALAHPGRERGN
ncbi:MAG: hypothetical protein K0R40_717 [Burkholderiales bacterium]|nr:hypothetical protein [Burkholderiales bacterium]